MNMSNFHYLKMCGSYELEVQWLPNTFSLLYLVVSCSYICQSLMHQAEISYTVYQPPADLVCFILFLFCKFYQEWCICFQEQG